MINCLRDLERLKSIRFIPPDVGFKKTGAGLSETLFCIRISVLFIQIPARPLPPSKRKDTILKRFIPQPFVLQTVGPTISLCNFLPANGFDKDIHPPPPPPKMEQILGDH